MRRPLFIAEQARNAKGMLGRLIAFVMARETLSENVRAIDALDVKPRDHVLDIGCGHGRSLEILAARATRGRVAGADPSELMAEIAVTRNRALVKARKVDVAIAAADTLPFDDASFDKALCVHVIYFWESLDASFREIARVLRSGARLALVFRTDADKTAVASFPSEVYHFRPRSEVIAALMRAGFAVQVAERDAEPILAIATKQNVSAVAP
jgi:ubiquinone/menaquinone biosynthesis C-methylase UbiE